MKDPYGPGLDRDSIIAAVNDRAQQILLPPWPIFSLAGPDLEGYLGGAREDETGVAAIKLDFRPPDSHERLMVQTQPDDGRRLHLPAAIGMLRERLIDGNPIHLSTMTAEAEDNRLWRSAEALVEGHPVPALTYASDALTVWQVLLEKVTVVAAAWQTPLDRLALTRIDDLTPLKLRRTHVIRRWLSQNPAP